MMISFKHLSRPMSFNNTNVNVLVLENKKVFRDAFLFLSSNDENSAFVFSENFEPLDFNRDICFIKNSLLLDFKEKRLQTKINSDMSKILNEVYFDEFEKLQYDFSQIIFKFSENFDFEFFSSAEITPRSIVKFLSFEPKCDITESSLDNLLFYLELFKKYLNIKCFVTYNLFVYYEFDELKELFKSLKLNNILLLDIENKVPDYSMDDIIISVVDNSLCSIVDN